LAWGYFIITVIFYYSVFSLKQHQKFRENLSKRKDLKYKKYLSNRFYPSLLNSWVSSFPLFTSFIAEKFSNEVSLLQTRVFLKKPFRQEIIKNSDNKLRIELIKKALQKNWINIKFLSTGQTNPYIEPKERRQIKYLIVRIDINFFKPGTSLLRRLMQLISIVEVYVRTYKNVRIVVQCYDTKNLSNDDHRIFSKKNRKLGGLRYHSATLYSFLGFLGHLKKLKNLRGAYR